MLSAVINGILTSMSTSAVGTVGAGTGCMSRYRSIGTKRVLSHFMFCLLYTLLQVLFHCRLSLFFYLFTFALSRFIPARKVVRHTYWKFKKKSHLSIFHSLLLAGIYCSLLRKNLARSRRALVISEPGTGEPVKCYLLTRSFAANCR